MIQKYKAFLRAVEFGNFTKAAQTLNYTQSGVSRMIQDLEREWGFPLFERSNGGITITKDGLALVPQLKRLCNEHDALLQQVSSLRNVESGIIRIGTFSSVATHWLPHMIKQFKQHYPHVDFELLLGDYKEIEEWIVDGRVDFGFLGRPTSKPMETIFVERDRLLVVLPCHHQYADAEVFPLHALSESPFMLLEKGENDVISRIFEQHGIKPEVHFKTWDDYAIMSMVENELGISILPELILKRNPYDVVIKELEVPIYREIQIGLRNEATLSIAAKRFLKYLPYRDKEGMDRKFTHI